jgi:hypothetical protein
LRPESFQRFLPRPRMKAIHHLSLQRRPIPTLPPRLRRRVTCSPPSHTPDQCQPIPMPPWSRMSTSMASATASTCAARSLPARRALRTPGRRSGLLGERWERRQSAGVSLGSGASGGAAARVRSRRAPALRRGSCAVRQRAARVRATSSKRGAGSTPVTRAPCSAASNAAFPVPQPRSRTRSPRLRAAVLITATDAGRSCSAVVSYRPTPQSKEPPFTVALNTARRVPVGGGARRDRGQRGPQNISRTECSLEHRCGPDAELRTVQLP